MNILLDEHNLHLTMVDKALHDLAPDCPSDLICTAVLSPSLNTLQSYWPFQMLLDKPSSSCHDIFAFAIPFSWNGFPDSFSDLFLHFVQILA